MTDPRPTPPPDPATGTPGDAYLWDRTGTPDPLVERLESALSTVRHRGTAAEFLDRRAAQSRVRILASAIAAAVLLTSTVLLVLAIRTGPPKPGPGIVEKEPPPAPPTPNDTKPPQPEIVKKPPEPKPEITPTPTPKSGWEVAIAAPDSKIGEVGMEKVPVAFRGQWVETGGTETTLKHPQGAGVSIGPNSMVRVGEGEGGKEGPHPEAFLQTGRLTATTSESERLRIGVSSAEVLVAGGASCEVRQDEKGPATVSLDRGEAEVVSANTRTRLAPGLSCTIEPGRAPGLPRSALMIKEDGKFPEMLDIFEEVLGKMKGTPDSVLDPLLKTATRRDAAVLWNVMGRVDDDTTRRRVAERIAALVANDKKAMLPVPKVIDPAFTEKLWRLARDAR